jgi:hypothetical protein
MVPERGDPQALNRYSYVRNNPVKYIDPSGHCWGIASGLRNLPTYDVTCNNLDMALTIAQHPEASTEAKAGAVAYIAVEGGAHLALVAGSSILAWEGGVAVAGSVKAATTAGTITTAACADLDCTNEAVVAGRLGLNAFTRAAEFGIRSYNELSKALSGTGLRAHHVIEQRFATRLGLDPNLMRSVALTPEEHQAFTNAWRNLIPYSNSGQALNTTTATREQIWWAAQQIYAKYPELLEAARQTLFGTQGK